MCVFVCMYVCMCSCMCMRAHTHCSDSVFFSFPHTKDKYAENRTRKEEEELTGCFAVLEAQTMDLLELGPSWVGGS